MQSKGKNTPFTIKHVEPIKIRKVRVSSRKVKKPITSDEHTTSTEYGNSTAVTQKSMNRCYTHKPEPTKETINFSHTLSRNDPFADIQEIRENLEDDEDSVILTLNELLSQQMPIKEEFGSKDNGKKPPLSGLKVKLREKIIPIKSERMLNRVASHRILFK